MNQSLFAPFRHRHPFFGLLAVLGVLLVSPALVRAWTPTTPQVTVTTFGDAGNDLGNAITIDTSGNTYTTGQFAGTVDFDPGVGATTLTSAGGVDAFIAKLNPSGDLVWARAFGGPLDDVGLAIALDTTGNIYVSGGFRDTADLDPGAGTVSFTSAGGQDAFVSKFDSTGSLLWARTAGASVDDRARSIAVDASNNVIAFGYFQGTVDFDPGVGTTSLTTAGSSDVFVWKFDSAGAFVWVRQAGGSSIDNPWSMALGTNGDIYATGSFMVTADFDPSAGTSNLTAVGALDAFVWKLNSSGTLVWARQFSGSQSEAATAITIDSSADLLVSMQFQGIVDFDPGVGTTNITSVGGFDAAIVKLDSSGSLVWVKSIGSTGTEIGQSITLDSSNNAHITGNFSATVDFDPGVGTTNLTSVGSTDIYVLKLDSSGAFVWVRQVGSTGNDYGYGITSDSSGSTYITGAYQLTADFDPEVGTSNLISAGSNDAYVWKLDAVGVALIPTTSTSTTLSTVAPTTSTIAPTSTVASGAVNIAAVATTTSTTVTAQRSVMSTSMPTTGSSTMSFVMWSILILTTGVVLQLRVRYLIYK